ncbi:biotin--[acetyl-CoA-carboxylase] ligase [Rhodobacteraceae bacterium W635]|uniref:biotin--[acetyl-CoA-carboxylase] ligase n=1 Tax=Nioella halotolerans TaxID=2303578 RepID=UPI000E3E7BD7|nr:biotin--[acetyl-CoA-carboxylase] ligase [Rhodobacteraceae bacterium W635]
MQGWPEGVGRRVLASVDSTMAEGARIAPTLSGPEWVLARAQTAGHGRRGRVWSSAPGNFYASLVMRPEGTPRTAALRSFVAALALREALVGATGRAEAVSLKWPNDVLLNSGKVAGILLESLGAGQGRDVNRLIIGVGVNLVTAPAAQEVEPGAVTPVSLMSETGIRVEPEAFLDLLAPAYARFEAQFATYGFAPIRAEWLRHAARLGQTITARTMSESVTGRFDTIDEAGNLILQTAKGERRIPAADIFF